MKLIVDGFQIFDHAYKMLSDAWEKNTYGGFGTTIYCVDHDTTSTDFVTDSQYAKSRDFLAPSELVDEYRFIMEHRSSNLYRWEFRQCRKSDCHVCPKPRAPSSPLEHFYEKFGGHMPSPVPFWASFPKKDSGLPASFLTPGTAAGDQANPEHLHYRVLSDLIKLNIPGHMLYPDQHYEGPTCLHECPECEAVVSHKSAAALRRHMKMLHMDN